MLDNDNIISTSVSETVEKIPTDKKIIANAPLRALVWRASVAKKNYRRHFT